MSKSELIKELAFQGKFQEIEKEFDQKKCLKAQEYVLEKLRSLDSAMKDGKDVNELSFATPFMLFAVKTFTSNDVRVLGDEFNCTEVDSDLDLHSSPTDSLHLDEDNGKAEENDEMIVAEVSDSETLTKEQKKTEDKAQEEIEGEKEAKPKTKSFQKPVVKPKSTHDLNEVLDASKKNGVKKNKGDSESKQKSDRKKSAGKEHDRKRKESPVPPKKLPVPPKGALGSYMFYSKHYRESADAVGKTFTEVAKLAGEMWRAMSDVDKSPFEQLAAEDKLRYQTEYATFLEDHPTYEQDKKDAAKAKKRAAEKADDSGAKKRSSNRSNKCEEAKQKPLLVKKPFSVSKKSKKDLEVVSDCSDRDDNDDADEECNIDDTEHQSETSGAKKRVLTREVSEGSSSSDDEKPSNKRRKTKKSVDLRQSISKKPVSSSAFTSVKKSVQGIKQCDLAPEEDLLNSDLVPYQGGKFPEDVKLRVGQQVMLLLAPYREFISQLPEGTLDEELQEDIQKVCSHLKAMVLGTIKELETVPSATEGHEYRLIRLSANGFMYVVLHADFSSPLHTSDVFLLDKKKYKESLKYPWIQVNAQVRRAFLCDETGEAEWHEGNIYYITPDFEQNPYKSVKVVWLRQEQGTMNWLYAYMQTDCDCSPWELELSSFVLLEKLKPAVIPKSLLVGKLQSSAILSYLKTFDAAASFLEDVSLCAQEEFYRSVPEEDRLDLRIISQLCRQGRYEEEGGIGITVLFEDLQKMVRNSKLLNDSNRAFLPWRQSEIMEKAVFRLKCALAESHDIPSLRLAAAEDVQETLELIQNERVSEEV